MLKRHSSRQGPLTAFLSDRLKGASSYHRIAGYFRSSIFDLIYEDIAAVPMVRIVCNSELDEKDVQAAREAHVAQAMVDKWNSTSVGINPEDTKVNWSRLYRLLRSENVKIRVVSRQDAPFLHGKAGLIRYDDGRTVSFVGSINETANGWRNSYELAWEDRSPEAAAWVQEEYDHLDRRAHDLADAVIEEVGRTSRRVEVSFHQLKDKPLDLIKGVTVESPLVRSGQTLAPWQKAFVEIFAEHRRIYGSARILLADEVGVGKTLSMAASSLLSVLQDGKPALILAPSTLTWQWQTELWDKLRVPISVWGRAPRGWHDHKGHVVRDNTDKGILRCPTRIGIVSTGIFVADTADARTLGSEGRFGSLSLDEGHKARVNRGISGDDYLPNNLYKAMETLAVNADNLVIGTATPIQTDNREIMDLLRLLARGNNHVLGRNRGICWHSETETMPVLSGKSDPDDLGTVWDFLRNPLPPREEGDLFRAIRNDLNIADDEFFTDQPLSNLDDWTREDLERAVARGGFLKEYSPLYRHVVLRRRKTLEEAGLMKPIAVNIHPNENSRPGFFEGRAIPTDHIYENAYEQVERFKDAMKLRSPRTSFIGKLMLQRICSSYLAGYNTARALLEKRKDEILAQEQDDPELFDEIDKLGIDGFILAVDRESGELQRIVDLLAGQFHNDPKLRLIDHFLNDMGWLHTGCIVFSQYYDTVRFVAEHVSRSHPNQIVAVYAGLGKSGTLRGGEWSSCDREDIKEAVKDRKLGLVFATDAACEGLNLQTLGTLINNDLPWNPARLEQRLGRIRRMGQIRDEVDMANLVYKGTIDERRYEVLSDRMKDRYDILGSIPDTIDDDWIDDIEELEERIREFTRRKQSQSVDQFEKRYGNYLRPVDGEKDDWEIWSQVISRPDLEKELLRPWR